MTNELKVSFEDLVKEHAIDKLKELNDDSVYGCDLHNKLFNTDYFVIGNYQASQILNDYDTFTAIDEVINYEKDNFGEVNTEITAEKICNMLAYIKGEELFNTSKTLQDNWDNYLSQETIDLIISELQ